MTNREAVSEAINDLRALNIDDRISERYVLSKLRHFNGIFLKRDNDQLRLFYDETIWLSVECIELEAVDYTKCSDQKINKVNSYMRSKLQLPQIYSYRNGALVRTVMTLDEGNTYRQTNLVDFNKAMKREYQDNAKYFYFRNGHLILPNSTAKRVMVEAAWVYPEQAKQLSGCNAPLCVEPFEEQFPCPSHLWEAVRQEAVNDLFKFYKRVIVDELPDQDTNTKTTK